MKSDLVKAATILGVCAGVGIVAASVVIVLGVRWAVDSALQPHMQSLNATVTDAAKRVDASVGSASLNVSSQIEHSAAGVEMSVATVSTRLANASDAVAGELNQSSARVSGSLNGGIERLSETLLTGSGHVGDRIDGGATRVSEIVARGFHEPFRIAAPQPLPVTGTLAIEGSDADEAKPVEVDANILGNGG